MSIQRNAKKRPCSMFPEPWRLSLVTQSQIYLFSGSILSINSMAFSYMVNTMPPLIINRASRGRAPLQKVSTPSFLKINAAQWKLFLYRFRASMLCILVLIVSSGCVTYTVMRPAMPPMPKVAKVPSFSPGAVYDCASWRKKV